MDGWWWGQAWSTVVCAVEGLISQASLVRYLYGLLLASTTTTAQQREGLEAHQADEQEAGQAGEDDSRAAVASSSTAVEEGEARARREVRGMEGAGGGGMSVGCRGCRPHESRADGCAA